MDPDMIRENSPEPSISDYAHLFNNTMEGTLIRYLRCHGEANLNELIEYVISNKNLRTKYSKRYRNKNIEKLALSKLVAKQRIFLENKNKTWRLDESAATEYEGKIMAKIKEIHEKKKSRSRSRNNKEDKNKLKEEVEFKILNKLVDTNIFSKLEQLEEILKSSNEGAQKQVLAFFEPPTTNNST